MLDLFCGAGGAAAGIKRAWPDAKQKANLNKRVWIADPDAMVSVVGHMFRKDVGAAAMQIDWMLRRELAQAIPPAYSEYLCKQVMP